MPTGADADTIKAATHVGTVEQKALQPGALTSEGQIGSQVAATDLQPGDSFRVLFEKSSHDGEFSGYGAILGASITVDGRRLQAFRWEDPATGKAG